MFENEGTKTGKEHFKLNANHDYNGWFVGYIVTENSTCFFATNIEPKNDFDFDTFIQKRADLTFAALELMGFVKGESPK